MIGHVVLVAAAAPSVIVKTDSSFAAFIIGLLLLCVGTGFFKANISPMLAEQNQDTRLRVEERKGERVIVDPAVTNARIFMYFYFCINIGSMAGQISMVFAEKYVCFQLEAAAMGYSLTAYYRSAFGLLSSCQPSFSSLAPLFCGGRRRRYVLAMAFLSGNVFSVSTNIFSLSAVPSLAPDWLCARDLHQALLAREEGDWLVQEAQLGRGPPVQDSRRSAPRLDDLRRRLGRRGSPRPRGLPGFPVLACEYLLQYISHNSHLNRPNNVRRCSTWLITK